MPSLVIVESPTKARTISRFLPSSKYTVMASLGHVRDLPKSAKEVPAKYKKDGSWATLAVRIENGEFKPIYIIPQEKRKVVKELRDALSEADELLIATDEDREGEAIGWHLVEVLKPKVPVRRMVFHEITKRAIDTALSNTREVNYNLVAAQESRRILDRLVGYKISPVLWKKIGKGTSAGRVQSVAVRLLVEREKKRMIFVPALYWDLEVKLQANSSDQFNATMTHLNEKRLATGRDFDDNTGELKKSLKESNVFLLKREEAEGLASRLPYADWRVSSVVSKERKRTPAPPFITSSLQQEGSRKFGWGAKKTMMVAQKLYERGFITYMRTDSVTLSQEALSAAREAILRTYGSENLSEGVRRYKSKVANAQEAHEAIRPAGREMKTGVQLGLSGDEQKLYDLIWKRTVASQMADARVRDVRADSTAILEDGTKAQFRSTGRQILFPGFLLVYVEGTDDPQKAQESATKHLPNLEAEQPLQCLNLDSKSHETKPPARYTEASLIQKLEKEGIGRPSTYASIISTIQDRGSVVKSGSALGPTFRAFATNALMLDGFESLVDTGFTAQMEKKLDEIAQGKAKGQEFLYRIDQGEKGIETLVEIALSQVNAREVSTISSPKWKKCLVRVGRYGPYVEVLVEGKEMRSKVPDHWLPADVDDEQLLALLKSAKAPAEQLGIHPDTGRPILLKSGAYGPYIEITEPEGSSEKPQRKSIPKGVKLEDVSLEFALELLKFPVELGLDPKSGERIFFDKGQYGPYVKRGRLNASVRKGLNLTDITLEEAVELLDKKAAEPPKRRRRTKRRK
ncbi:MAG: type I DNA topoisomerase [Bacteroidetes bacterium]|nr:type I DNA topoisomerase [Bacteroidota bacterium]